MKELSLNGFEILSDGRTTWVNGPDGCCLGRFSRYGIDVHHTAPMQISHGRQCLSCIDGPITDIRQWDQFKYSMQDHYGVSVSDQFMPDYLMREE